MDEFKIDDGGNPVALLRLRKQIEEYKSLESDIEKFSDLGGNAKTLLHKLKTEDIPETMGQLGSSDFTDAETSLRVVIDDFVSGSLPKEDAKRAEAIEELTRLGGSALLKTELSIVFPKEQAKVAAKLIAQLTKAGYPVEVRESVHPVSLVAFVKEVMRAGKHINWKKLAMFHGKTTKVAEPKAKKGKAS